MSSHLDTIEQRKFDWPDLYSYSNSLNSKDQKQKKKLVVEELLTNHIFVVRNFLTPELCSKFIDLIDLEISQNKEKYNVKPTFNPEYAYRDNARISVTDSQFATDFWHLTGLSKLLSTFRLPFEKPTKYPTGLLENIRLYRYAKGQRFGKHYDDFLYSKSGARTEFTLLIYLNEGSQLPKNEKLVPDTSTNKLPQLKESLKSKKKRSNSLKKSKKSLNEITKITYQDVDIELKSEPLVGGETVFYCSKPKFEISVKPETGMLLLHKHGHDCLLHEGKEVTSGYKYLFRSDLLF
ncbi:hypothetical protein BB560_001635 [Smittium megazygosporum]|uniref:Prolyl 4-hydroxylase alpha subunit domain-containing protein n=1 Tax=Smittium megazygosporum TaxID=133381 RepID=A0A2T9ZGZ0_9FUNG|nr:hypothetical protein BB560_001635 [Smittium megazygosporum]